MVRFVAHLLPVAALGLGSGIGLGQPSAAELVTLRLASSSKAVAPKPPGFPSFPEGQPVPSVDTSLLPDPNPWPVLNPGDQISRAWLLAEGPVPVEGNGRRLVTFTFDDGPFPETTPVVLHVLAKHHVHATFFMIGRYLDGTSDRATRAREVALHIKESATSSARTPTTTSASSASRTATCWGRSSVA